MTDRLRVLFAILSRPSEEFTATDLASRTGVNLATVRTILHRERRYLDEKGRLEASARGGRAIRYILSERERQALEQEFAVLRSEFSVPLPVHQPPAMLIAAEDILRRQYPVAAHDRQAALLNAARKSLESAERVLRQRPPAEADLYQNQVQYLKTLADSYEYSRDGRQALWTKIERALRGLGDVFHGAAAPQSAVFAPVAPSVPTDPVPALACEAGGAGGDRSDEPSKLARKNLVDTFFEARRHAAAAAQISPEVELSKEAKIEAARFFRERVRQQVSEHFQDEIAHSILIKQSAELPIESLAVLGADPACYGPDVVGIAERPKNILVRSFKYNAACQEFDYSASPIQQRMVAAGAGY